MPSSPGPHHGGALLTRTPRVLQSRDAIENRMFARVVHAVGHKVAMSLKLKPHVRRCALQAGLQLGLYRLQALWVDGCQEVFAPCIGLWVTEEAIIDPHLCIQRIPLAHPSDHTFDLDAVGARGSTFGVSDELGQDLGHVTFFVGDASLTLDHIAVFQTNFVARKKPKETLGRRLSKIGLLDPQIGRE